MTELHTPTKPSLRNFLQNLRDIPASLSLSGIAAGFITGLLGNAIYSAVFLTMWATVIEGGALIVVEMIVRLLFLATSWAFGNAAAGGTAQLLRTRASAASRLATNL